LELCKELQFAKETLQKMHKLQASSKAQMMEAQEKCSEREQSLADELTEALAMNKSLKEDLAHAEGALHTANCACELAGESSLLAAKGLAEERAAALAVSELAARSEAELRAELEDSRQAANDTKQALEARLVDMERQLRAATTGDCKVHGIDHEAQAPSPAAIPELGPTPVGVQLMVDGNNIANSVDELDACRTQLPATLAEEIEQDVQQQSCVRESHRYVAGFGSRPEELLNTDHEKDEQQDLQVHSCNRLSKQIGKGGKESCKPLCLPAGAHRMLRSCAPRVVGTPLRFVAMLAAVLLMCGSLGSVGFGAFLDVSTNMTCFELGDEAGLQPDQ